MGRVLDAQVHIEPQQPNVLTVRKRTRFLSYYCMPKEDVTDEYILVTTPQEVANYTDDIRINKAFSNGLNSVYLALHGNITDFTELSLLTYSMLCSQDTNDVVEDVDFSTFRNTGNLIWYTNGHTESLDVLDSKPRTLAKTFATGFVYANDTESLGVELLSNAISPTLNPNWNPLTYKQFPDNTTVIRNAADIDNSREAQFTFIDADTTDSLVPELMYFRAGGYNAIDYYIVEDLRVDVQVAIRNNIANSMPRYTNPSIASLISAGENVIKSYVQRDLIESATLKIPNKADQLSTDIINGLVDGLELTINIGGAIWYVRGTATYRINNTEVSTATTV